jgi:hypothetical protein
MYIGFSKTLIKLGGIRIGVGKRMKGSTGWIMLLFYGMLQVTWWMIVGTLWMMYGIGWLFVYLPIKGIINLYKKHRKN